MAVTTGCPRCEKRGVESSLKVSSQVKWLRGRKATFVFCAVARCGFSRWSVKPPTESFELPRVVTTTAPVRRRALAPQLAAVGALPAP